MSTRIFLIALCAFVFNNLLAQKQYGGPYNPIHIYTEGEWYKPGKDECGCKPGFYPLNNIVSPTQWGCELQKCVKSGEKKTTPKVGFIVPPPDTCCEVTNIYNQQVYNYGDTAYNDNRSYLTVNNYYEQKAEKAGFTLHGVAKSRWFGELDVLRSTDHYFKAAFPVVRLGWQVEGYLKEAPGLILQFETNLVGFQGNSEVPCTSCVPQDIAKPNLGLQIKGSVKWQFSKKNSLTAYRKSTTVMLTKREAVPLPDEGWGVELERKIGPAALHAGWIKNSSKSNTIYFGISANASEKSSGVKEDRGVYKTPDKLYSKRSEERAARKAERKAKVAKQKAEQKEKDRLEKERFETLVSSPIVLDQNERTLVPSYPGQSKKFSKINEEKLKLFSLVEENQKLWSEITDNKPTKKVRQNVQEIENLRKKIAKMEEKAK